MAIGDTQRKFEVWTCGFDVSRSTAKHADRHVDHNTSHSYLERTNRPNVDIHSCLESCQQKISLSK